MRISYNDAVELTRLRKVAFAQGSDIDSIWDIYINVFTSPISGSKKCGQCIREAFNQLLDILDEDRSQPLWEEWYKNGGKMPELKIQIPALTDQTINEEIKQIKNSKNAKNKNSSKV